MVGPSIWKIAWQLVLRGILFHMLLSQSQVEDLRKDHPFLEDNDYISIEAPTYTWSDKEYKLRSWDQSLLMRKAKAILNLPWGHKALAMGGMVWQVALELLMLDDVLSGPSIQCQFNPPLVLNGVNYYDDILTIVDQDIICGSYRILTGLHFVHLCF